MQRGLERDGATVQLVWARVPLIPMHPSTGRARPNSQILGIQGKFRRAFLGARASPRMPRRHLVQLHFDVRPASPTLAGGLLAATAASKLQCAQRN